ncbi:SOS response-associated peptidase [Thalassotalea agarivorans]|uniref:Abasic site processing protein n=1 Tax=Thalassotalea agarivorans TaxID=349064 RepID=A0A1H9Y2U0_THASX|nr:SOS response-associated peptidase [Thalassotalea agarivorans]SES63115.1 Putative SOS response-associated peptidase YedK [Thalassotalea agarivorans]
MCGRLNVLDDPLAQMVSDLLGINFSTETNVDLCPSQRVAAIIKPPSGFQQLDTIWGIQPVWAKKLLINAQSETIASKPTFRESIQIRRCLVPCTGWYEWKTEAGKKQKYSFTHSQHEPFYMAGIWYDHKQPELVTLTTRPNELCGQIHSRMPVIITPDNIDYWFHSSVDALPPLFDAIDEALITIEKAS